MTNENLYTEDIQKAAQGHLSALDIAFELKNSEDLEDDLMQVLLEIERVPDWGDNDYLCDLYDLLRFIQKEIIFYNPISDLHSANLHSLVAFANLLFTPGLAICKNTARAETLLLEIIEVDSTNEYARTSLAALYLSYNDEGFHNPETAYELLVEVIRTRPDYSFALAKLGELLRLGDRGVKKDEKAAYHYLQRALESDPMNFGALISLAKIYRHGNALIPQDLKKAVDYYTAAYEIDPFAPIVLTGLAELLSCQLEGVPYDPKRATELIEEALIISPNDAVALTLYGEHLLVSTGDLIKARQCIEKAISLEPKYGYAYVSLADLYLKSVDGVNSDWMSALSCFKTAYELGEQNLFVTNNLTELYRRQGDYHKAGEMAEKSLQITPDQPYPLWQLGQIYKCAPDNLRDLSKACSYFEKALALDPTCYHIMIDLAIVLSTNSDTLVKNTKKAHELFLTALQINPNDPYLLNHLSEFLYIEEEVRDTTLALELVKKSLLIEKTNPFSHELLAHIILQEHLEKDYYLAYEHLEQALALDPNNFWAAVYLVRVLIYGMERVPINLDRADAIIKYNLEKDPTNVYFISLQTESLTKREELNASETFFQKIKKRLHILTQPL